MRRNIYRLLSSIAAQQWFSFKTDTSPFSLVSSFAVYKPVNAIECKECERKPNPRAPVYSVRITNKVPFFPLRFLWERFTFNTKRICFSLT